MYKQHRIHEVQHGIASFQDSLTVESGNETKDDHDKESINNYVITFDQ